MINQGVVFHVSPETKRCYLGYIGDYTTQWYRDYNKPLCDFLVFFRSLVKKHFWGKRTLVTSIFSTVKSLAWALLLLVLIVYLDEITWRQLAGKRVDSIQEQVL